MNPEINFTIHDWMVKRLKLKGAKLFICGFMFTARQKIGNEWRRASQLVEASSYSERTVFYALSYLTEKQILRVRKLKEGNNIFFEYRFNEKYVFDIVFLKDKTIE